MIRARKFSVLLGIALAAVMVMGIGASGAAAAKPRVAIVFATGGLGDKSFNDSAYDGMKRAEKELGIEFDKVEPQAVAEYESLLMRFAQTRKLTSSYPSVSIRQTRFRSCRPDFPIRSSPSWTR